MEFGESRRLSSLSLDDVLKHPVWVSNLAIEGLEDDGLETEHRAWLAGDNIEIQKLHIATILLNIDGSDRYALGSLLENDPKTITSIIVFGNEGWRKADWYFPAARPMIYISVPPISGCAGVKFVAQGASSWDARMEG